MDDQTPDQEPRHPIRVVSERTGLSPDVLRAWEKRYRAVQPPRRDGAAQRLYSDADVERLRLLRRVTQAGRSIGQVAEMTTRELLALAREDEAQRVPAPTSARRLPADAAAAHVERALDDARALDGAALETSLRRALLAVGADDFVDRVAVPFLRAVGDAWEEGSLGVAHEHLASAVLRRVLGFLTESVERPDGALEVVVATPQRQVHELGAMLAAAAAASAGWRVTYLGADLPAEEIAAAARSKHAAAVALSIVYVHGGADPSDELRRLRRALPSGTALFVGGQGACALDGVLEEIHAAHLPSFAELRRALEQRATMGPVGSNGNGNGNGNGRKDQS